MKKQSFLFILILLCGMQFADSSIWAQCSLDKHSWTPIFEEEFNSNSVNDFLNNNSADHTTSNLTPWQEDIILMGVDLQKPPCALVTPSIELTFSNGIGSFHAEKQNGQYHTTAIWSTHNDFTGLPNPTGFLYGMFEIRCKLSHSTDAYNSFWLSKFNTFPEIDVFESSIQGDINNPYNNNGLSPDNSFFSTVHWIENNAEHNCGTWYLFNGLNYYDLYNNFHTWTVVWTPTQITWFFDGKELRTDNDPHHQPGWQEIANLIPNQPAANDGPLWNYFNNNKMIIRTGEGIAQCNNDEYRAYNPVQVDYIKVYRPTNMLGYDAFKQQYPSSYPNSSYYAYLKNFYTNTPYKPTTDWVRNIIETQQYAPVNADDGLCGFQGGGKYMYKGTNGYLWTTYYGVNNQFYSAVADWTHPVDGNVTLAVNGDMTYYTYNHQLYNVYNNTCTTLTGASDVSSDIVANNNGSELYYKNTNNFLNYYGYSNPLNPVYGSISGYFPPAPAPYYALHWAVKNNIIADPNNFYQLYYINTYNEIVSAHINPSNFSLSTASVVTPTQNVYSDLAISQDGNKLFYRTVNNELYYISRANANAPWGTQTAFQAHMGGNPVATTVNNVKQNILIGPNVNNPQFYYVGTDSRPWVIYYTGPDFVAAPIDDDLPNIAGDFKLIKYGQNPPNTTHIAYRDINKKIRTLEYLPCQITNPACNNVPNYYLEKNSNNPDTTLLSYEGNSGGIYKMNELKKVKHNGETITSLSPNPTKGLSYYSSNNFDDVYKIQISTIDGRLISVTNTSGKESTVPLDISNQAAGVYIVSVYSKSGINKYKLLKE